MSVAIDRRNLAFLKNRSQNQEAIHAKYDLDNFTFELFDKNGDFIIKYKPTPTLLRLHQDTKHLGKHAMGPFGSGKSVSCISHCFFRAVMMPKCIDGIRRYRVLIVRDTYTNLKETTIKTWEQWFGKLGNVKFPKNAPPSYKTVFNDEYGEVHLEAIFLALNRDSHIEKLKSFETTDYYYNELAALPKVIYTTAFGRTVRYPMASQLGDAVIKTEIMSDTNPPDEDSWLYDMFELNKPDQLQIFKQPPGLIKDPTSGKWIDNPEAENMRRNGYGLNDDYYLNMTIANDDSYINVFACGNYGSFKAGDLVYNEYNDDLHAADDVSYNSELLVNISMDFGGTPAAIISQDLTNGRKLLLAELTSNDPGLRQFINSRLIPFLEQNYNIKDFKKQCASVTGDPAGNTRNETDAKTCYDIIKECGFSIESRTVKKTDDATKQTSYKKVYGAHSNNIETRLDAVKSYLSALVDGKPKIIVSKNCKTLRKGFNGGYVLDKVEDGNTSYFKKKPRKNFYSHIHDALQYECMRKPVQAKQVVSNFTPQMIA